MATLKKKYHVTLRQFHPDKVGDVGLEKTQMVTAEMVRFERWREAEAFAMLELGTKAWTSR